MLEREIDIVSCFGCSPWVLLVRGGGQNATWFWVWIFYFLLWKETLGQMYQCLCTTCHKSHDWCMEFFLSELSNTMYAQSMPTLYINLNMSQYKIMCTWTRFTSTPTFILIGVATHLKLVGLACTSSRETYPRKAHIWMNLKFSCCSSCVFIRGISRHVGHICVQT